MPSNNDQKLNSFPADSNNNKRIEDDTGNETMIEQTARVVSTRQGYAIVSPLGKKNCNSCASKTSGCSSQAFFSFFQNKDQQHLEVLNPLHASPGDEVVIGVQGRGLVMFSLFAYLMPLLTLVVFAVLGSQLFAMMGASSELGAVLAGIAGLFGGFRLARFLSEISARAYDFQPVILRQNVKEDLIAQPLQFADFK